MSERTALNVSGRVLDTAAGGLLPSGARCTVDVDDPHTATQIDAGLLLVDPAPPTRKQKRSSGTTDDDSTKE